MGKRSEKNIFSDGYTHYEDGHKTGTSMHNFFGDGYTHYDAKGNKTGRSERDFFGNGYIEYDNKGNKIGRTERDIFGDGYTFYDAKGNKTGHVSRTMSGGYAQDEGCFVATYVYGSYDSPEVWTLRRFRDYYLYQHYLGRIFIQVYYYISPKIIKVFENKKIFKKFFKTILDHWTAYLISRGYENTPYYDQGRE